MKKLLLSIVLLLASQVQAADTASNLIACGVNDVQANCFATVMDATYGTLAAAGSAYSDCGAITKRLTYVTASDDAKGVCLPTPTVGYTYDIYNTVASKNLIVYPVSGGTINGGSANAAVTIYGKSGLRCLATSATAFLCSSLNAPTTRTLYVPAFNGSQGSSTTGWVNTGNDTSAVTLAAGSTNENYVIPIVGLQLGDTIVSYKVIAQIESAGNTATLDADMRKLVNAAADPADSSIGAITRVSATADTAVSSSKTLATAELIASGDHVYVLVLGTTAASTDIQLLGVEVVVNRDN